MKYSAPAAILLVSLLSLGLVFAQDPPESALKGTKQFRKRVVVSGLAWPWEVTWGPDSKLWVTERTGKQITRIDPASGERSIAITIDEVSAPGGQEGLLGMALHPELLKDTGNDYIYVYYTYVDEAKGADPTVADPASPYRYLYGKIVRLSYNAADGTLAHPVNVITGLPTGDDHNGGRLKFGPGKKLYLTIGDQGHDQLQNACLPVDAQRLPSKKELKARDYVAYVGKSLRFNLDGSVPKDNPKLNGVVSHVFTYGHRNPQGIDFGPDGTLYASEHGPKTDDEVNILKAGYNYGWPNVAGLKDDKAYEYARWADATTPCSQLEFSNLVIHPSVPREAESAYKTPFVEPIATLFTVPTGYNFSDPACKGIDYICWPTVGASSMEYYRPKDNAIPGWDHVLLVTALKRGSLYVVPLTADGQAAAGHISRYFQSENRYRDSAVSADGKTIYIATDLNGLAGTLDGGATPNLQDHGAILAFTYEGEGSAAPTDPGAVSETRPPSAGETNAATSAAGAPPQLTAAQAAAGKIAYAATCAACHGTTLVNGTYGTPLAGAYFKTKWYGQPLRALYEKAQKTMPPAAPGSLASDTYASVVAYILEFNGFKPGNAPLPTDPEALEKMAIQEIQ